MSRRIKLRSNVLENRLKLLGFTHVYYGTDPKEIVIQSLKIFKANKEAAIGINLNDFFAAVSLYLNLWYDLNYGYYKGVSITDDMAIFDKKILPPVSGDMNAYGDDFLDPNYGGNFRNNLVKAYVNTADNYRIFNWQYIRDLSMEIDELFFSKLTEETYKKLALICDNVVLIYSYDVRSAKNFPIQYNSKVKDLFAERKRIRNELRELRNQERTKTISKKSKVRKTELMEELNNVQTLIDKSTQKPPKFSSPKKFAMQSIRNLYSFEETNNDEDEKTLRSAEEEEKMKEMEEWFD